MSGARAFFLLALLSAGALFLLLLNFPLRAPKPLPSDHPIATVSAPSLAVIYLYTHRSWNHSLACSLFAMETNLLRDTPGTIYVFYRHPPPRPFLRQFADSRRLHFEAVKDEDWTLPPQARNASLWSMFPRFDADYRLMGQWRLTAPFRFAQSRGHDYLLFADDDAFVQGHYHSLTDNHENSSHHHHLQRKKTKQGHGNLLADLRSRQVNFAYRYLWPDPSTSALLPELVRDLVDKGIVTAPLTRLFEDCMPQNITGLFSSVQEDSGRGWRATTMPGHFLIISLSFWFRSDVQTFLNAVLESGGHVIYRWNEQAVFAMMRLLFSSESQELVLPMEALRVRHTKRCRSPCWRDKVIPCMLPCSLLVSLL